MFKEGKHWVPVEISNLAVTELEKRIATLEARNAALAAENERLKDELDRAKCDYAESLRKRELTNELNARLLIENDCVWKQGELLRDCVDSDTFPNTIAAWDAAKKVRITK